MSNRWNSGNTTDGLRPVRDLDYAYGGDLYRAPSYKWDVPYEEWRDEAACEGLPTQYFELGDPDEPEYDTDYQHKLIAKGLAACVDCPVRQSCLVNSNEEDRYWTIRGGQPPEGLFPDGKFPLIKLAQAKPGGFAKGAGKPRQLKQTCKHGHSDWTVDKQGKRRCAECRRNDNRDPSWRKKV